MELPVEIIYEISIQNPFKSFMPFLSKTTKKYWEDRTIRITDHNSEIGSVSVDLVIWPDRVLIDIDRISTKFREILSNAKFLCVQINKIKKSDIAEISRIMKNLVSVDLCNMNISKNYFKLFDGAKLLNYRYVLTENDRDIIESKFPESTFLFNDFTISLFSLFVYLNIVNDELVLVIHGFYISDGIKYLFNQIEHVEIFSLIGCDNDLVTVLGHLYQSDTIKTCKIYVTEYYHDNIIEYLKAIAYEIYGMEYDDLFVDKGKYVEVII